MSISSICTCVTCYYPVKNKHSDKFNSWFTRTLNVNCPYVFFTNAANIDFVKKFREGLPTYYIILELEDFETSKYRNLIVTDEIHCPSIELNMIWNEKIFMMERASEVNPFNSEWFNWMDAGICIFRNEAPSSRPLNPSSFHGLPKNKIIYSSSEPYDETLVSASSYYHHVSGCYMAHRDILSSFAWVYRNYLNFLMSRDNIWTDQVILTHIYKDAPGMFFEWFNGYGEIAKHLFAASQEEKK